MSPVRAARLLQSLGVKAVSVTPTSVTSFSFVALASSPAAIDTALRQSTAINATCLSPAETHPAEPSNEEASAALVAAIKDYSVDVTANGATFFAAPQSVSSQSRSVESTSGSGAPSFILPVAATIAGLVLVLALVLVLVVSQRKKRLSTSPNSARPVYSSQESNPLYAVTSFNDPPNAFVASAFGTNASLSRNATLPATYSHLPHSEPPLMQVYHVLDRSGRNEPGADIDPEFFIPVEQTATFEQAQSINPLYSMPLADSISVTGNAQSRRPTVTLADLYSSPNPTGEGFSQYSMPSPTGELYETQTLQHHSRHYSMATPKVYDARTQRHYSLSGPRPEASQSAI